MTHEKPAVSPGGVASAACRAPGTALWRGSLSALALVLFVVVVGLFGAGAADKADGGGARPGDVTGDGQISIADALVIAQLGVGLRDCSSMPTYESCDVSPPGAPDGSCNIGDALRIAQCSVGLVSCAFTCGPLACDIAICGNGIVEPGEDCDDGNTSCAGRCPPSCLFSMPCSSSTTFPFTSTTNTTITLP